MIKQLINQLTGGKGGIRTHVTGNPLTGFRVSCSNQQNQRRRHHSCSAISTIVRRGKRLLARTSLYLRSGFCAVLFVILSLPSLASDFYGVIGAGVAKHDTNGKDGIWFQRGFDHSIDSKSTVLQGGLGYQMTNWLAIEGLYHDFGKTSISSDFVLPDQNYDLETQRCVGRCNPLVHGDGEGRARGFSLSLVPSYGINRDWSVYAKVGVLWFVRDWHEKLKCCAPGTYQEGDIYGPRLHETFANTVSAEGVWLGDNSEVKPRSTGRAFIGSLGIRYRKVRMEYSETRGLRAMGSGHTNLGTFTISYKLQF